MLRVSLRKEGIAMADAVELALREIGAGALDPVLLWQRLLEPWREDVEEDGDSDGALGITRDFLQ